MSLVTGSFLTEDYTGNVYSLSGQGEVAPYTLHLKLSSLSLSLSPSACITNLVRSPH